MERITTACSIEEVQIGTGVVKSTREQAAKYSGSFRRLVDKNILARLRANGA